MWFLDITYLKKEGITEYLQNDLTTQLKRFSKTEKRGRIKSDPVNEKYLSRAFWDIESIFILFRYLVNGKISCESSEDSILKDVNEEKISPVEEFVARQNLKRINKKYIKKNYSEAFQLFKDNLYYNNFSDYISRKGGVFKLKESYVIFLELFPIPGSENQKIIFFSAEKEGLENFAKFLIKIGKITNFKLQLVFSPDNKILLPYFKVLNYLHKHILEDKRLNKLIEASIKNYFDREYKYSISDSGIIAEEYLTQIYETLFRKACSREASFGDLYSLLGRETSSILKTNSFKKYNLEDLYKKLEEAKKTKIKSAHEHNQIFDLIRESINYTNHQKSMLDISISNLNSSGANLIFPKIINENLKELRKYRNLVSHKSRIRIGSYETLTSIYSAISLAMWWESMKETIDLTKDKIEIIKHIIEDSRRYE